METEFRDARWQADYQTALSELLGGPRQLLLPAPTTAQGQYNVPVQERGLFNPDLEGSALREEIIRHLSIRKTESPFIREIRLDEQLIGKVARSPYQSMFWLSSLDRHTPFTSITDAAIHTVTMALGL